MKYFIIFLCLFSFLIISVIPFEDAFAGNDLDTHKDAPSPPRNLKIVSVGDGEVTLSWDKPLTTGPYYLQAYATFFKMDGDTDFTEFEYDLGKKKIKTITGLENDQLYYFMVRAHNPYHYSEHSTILSATPIASVISTEPPSLPINLVAVSGDKEIILTWDEPLFDDTIPPVTNYDIKYKGIYDKYWIFVASGTSTFTTETITDLVNDERYEFTVRAENDNGWGEWIYPVRKIPREPPATAPGVHPILQLDKQIYNYDDTINLICIPTKPFEIIEFFWEFPNLPSPILADKEYSFPASDFGIGDYSVRCHTDYGRPSDAEFIINRSQMMHFSIIDEAFLNITPEKPVEEKEGTETFTTTTETKNGGNSSCNDCTPPTIGVDSNGKRFVNNGLTLNGVSFQADLFKNHMAMMYTEIGVENHLEIKVYENGGAYNVDYMQFGIVKEIGSSMNISEPRLEIDIKNTAHDIENPGLEGVELVDKNGIINQYRVDVSLVECMEGFTQDCLKLDIYWTFAKVPENKVLAIGGWDNDRNSFTNYFNDGLTVTDPNYVEPILPEPYKYTCSDPSLDTIKNGGNRNNCHWRALHMGWLYN